MSAEYVTERASPGMPSLSSHSVARSPSPSRIEPTSAGVGLTQHADVGLGELVAEVGHEVADRAEETRAPAARGRGTTP